MRNGWVLAAALLLAANGLQAQSTPRDYRSESADAKAKRMKWFDDSRFGLFIHWGLYSMPAGAYGGRNDYGEWIMEQAKIPVSRYMQYADTFNPIAFDADEWVRMAKDAGVKYLVLTSKHHDGFGLWPSRMGDWNIARTPFGRDPVKELAAACRRHGIRLCFYHSIMDWHHSDWGTRRAWNDVATGTPDMDRYVAYMKGQLKELVRDYGPLGILWFDGEWESPWTHERAVDLYNYVRSLQPNIIINNRIGKGRAGMQGMDEGEGVGDYGTPEQEIPPTGFGPDVRWESCMTMNDHWGFNRVDENWKSAQLLIRQLIDCASKGGNYLLNVGPTPEGLFPTASIERLAAIGRWMKVNSESIYGTSASPMAETPWGRCTQKAGRLYLHVYDWPADGRLKVPIANRVTRAYLLADRGRRLPVTTTEGGGVTVQLPAAAPDADASVVVLNIRGAAEVIGE